MASPSHPSSPTPPSAARLCDLCRRLEFDDQKADGAIGTEAAGKNYLRMPASTVTGEGEESWNLPLEFEFVDLLPSLPSLEISANTSGCEFCRFVRDTILYQMADNGIQNKPQVRDFFSQSIECVIHLGWSYELPQEATEPGVGSLALLVDVEGMKGEGAYRVIVHAEAAEGHNRVADWLRIRAPPNISHWADARAITWDNAVIDRCIREHSHETGSFRPKRLINVQSQPVKLVRGEDIEPAPIYAALSYCWGSYADSQAQLRTDSEKKEAEFLLEIQDQALPAVVRDAVATTRLLSIPYLWVDALCIRQDDVASGGDWEEHTGVMHEIYGNARVTIAAPSSASCLQDFLHRNEPEIYISYVSTLQPEVSGLLRLRAEKVLVKDTNPGDVWNRNVEPSKWYSRVWTYQEMVASTRVLVFGKMDMLFSCPERSWYLGGPEEGTLQWEHQIGLDWKENCGFLDWEMTTLFYSGRLGITYLTDTFPALSGLARAYSTAAGLPETDYIAGMWKPHLLRSLCWQVVSTIMPEAFSTLLDAIVSPKPYVCPSWSWATRGFCGNVLPVHEWLTMKPEYRRLETHAVPKGQDPLGEITYAQLKVVSKVKCIPAVRLRRVRDHWTMDDPGGRHRWDIFLDWDPDGDIENCTGLRMLLIGSFSNKANGAKSLVGLLLHGTPQGTAGHLYRVGVFRSAENVKQRRGSAKKFFKNCVDEYVEVL